MTEPIDVPIPPIRAMRIGVIGATGFIGGRVARLLEARGHRVRVICREGTALEPFQTARERYVLPADLDDRVAWTRLVEGLDGLVCAAGVLSGASLRRVHERLPEALAGAAKAAGVARLVHLSATGASVDAPTAFLRSKAAGDAALLQDRLPGWTVLRPSLVYGQGGASASLFATLASLPVRPRVRGGWLRPIWVEDVASAVVACLEGTRPLPPVIEVVGPDRVTADGYVDAFADWLGVRLLVSLPVPSRLLDLVGRSGTLLGLPLVDAQSVAMLRRGADGDPDALATWTGVHPVGLSEGLRRENATEADRLTAYVGWLLPLLCLTLAVLWIGTGLVSFWSYSLGIDLLAQGGVTGVPASALLIVGAVWDLILGFGIFARQRIGLITSLQAGTCVFYTALATILVPDAWAHPFGPLLKNLPILAATLMAAVLTRR